MSIPPNFIRSTITSYFATKTNPISLNTQYPAELYVRLCCKNNKSSLLNIQYPPLRVIYFATKTITLVILCLKNTNPCQTLSHISITLYSTFLHCKLVCKRGTKRILIPRSFANLWAQRNKLHRGLTSDKTRITKSLASARWRGSHPPPKISKWRASFFYLRLNRGIAHFFIYIRWYI